MNRSRLSLTLAVVGSLVAALPATAQPALSEEETLAYLESAFQGCNGVSGVERSDVAFRIYTTSNFMHEFNIADINPPNGPTLSGVFLQCGTGSCIATSAVVGNSWKPLRPAAMHYLDCFGESEKVNRAIAYYLTTFSRNQVQFPTIEPPTPGLDASGTSTPLSLPRHERRALDAYSSAALAQVVVAACVDRGVHAAGKAEATLDSYLGVYSDEIVLGKSVFLARIDDSARALVVRVIEKAQLEVAAQTDDQLDARCVLLSADLERFIDRSR